MAHTVRFLLPARAARPVAVATSLTVMALGLTACGGVQIKPDAPIPHPIMLTMPTRVGLVVPADVRNYTHNETRWGVDWTVALGNGHVHLMQQVFKDVFDQVQEFKDLEEAKGVPDLKAIFEPRIEQYSFVTARETGGRYYACTIRYRINLYTPTGEKADSFTLTGYGNALAKGMSSGKPLEQASLAAMRDAAAKFLVQFPEQSVGTKLAHNEAVTVVDEQKRTTTADAGGIDTVPIEEATADAAPVPPAAPAAPPPSASAPAPKSS